MSVPSPHEVLAKLADKLHKLELSDDDPPDNEIRIFHRAVQLFVDSYGLLGWFKEEFGSPLLPERKVGAFVRVAPDTVIDEDGRMRDIDPSTEGKHLLEREFMREDGQWFAQRGQPLPPPSYYYLKPDQLILPRELRFQRPATNFFRTGFSRSAYHLRDERTFTYEDVRRVYGVRVVFDPQNETTGVVLVPTREPIRMWRQGLTSLGRRPSKGYLNRQLEEVRPFLLDDEEGREEGGWSCPSLLAAVHLMQYLDLVARVRMQKCQAPGCPEYFRVGPRSRESLYCPPPPGKNQSRCASRASSAMHRARQREGRKSDPT